MLPTCRIDNITSVCVHCCIAVYRKGYTCFPQTDIAGDLVGTALATPTVEACAWKCEAMSELCSFYVYTNTQLCVLMANAFAGEFGTTGPAASKTACLRALSGGECAISVCTVASLKTTTAQLVWHLHL